MKKFSPNSYYSHKILIQLAIYKGITTSGDYAKFFNEIKRKRVEHNQPSKCKSIPIQEFNALLEKYKK